MNAKNFGLAALAGVLSAIGIALIMTPAIQAGVSPLPKPLGLAIAQRLFGQDASFWLGVTLHVLYVTAWTVIYVAAFRDNLSFGRAFAVAFFMWVLVLIVFFPTAGWGFLGLAINSLLMVSSLITHFLWAFLVWILCRIVIKPQSAKS